MSKQEVARSTYSTSYRPSVTWRPVRYKDTPSFVSGTIKTGHLQEVPEQLGPRRQQEFEYGPGLGLGHSAVNTTRFLEPKPITGTQYPSNERQDYCALVAKNSPLFRNTDPFDDDAHILPAIRLAAARRDICRKVGTDDFDQSAWRYVWNSTAKRAAREGHLPTIKAPPLEGLTEPRADQVRFDPRKYEDTPAEWQQAYIWDRIQVRPPLLARRPSARPKKNTRRQTHDAVDMDTEKVDLIQKLARENKLSSI